MVYFVVPDCWVFTTLSLSCVAAACSCIAGKKQQDDTMIFHVLFSVAWCTFKSWTHCSYACWTSSSVLLNILVTTIGSWLGLSNTFLSINTLGSDGSTKRSCLVSQPSPRWYKRHLMVATLFKADPLNMKFFLPPLVLVLTSWPSKVVYTQTSWEKKGRLVKGMTILQPRIWTVGLAILLQWRFYQTWFYPLFLFG